MSTKDEIRRQKEECLSGTFKTLRCAHAALEGMSDALTKSYEVIERSQQLLKGAKEIRAKPWVEESSVLPSKAAPLNETSRKQMPGRDIIVIGASAGGVSAVQTLLPLLPADIPAAIFVALHRRRLGEFRDCLTEIFSGKTELAVDTAWTGEAFERGHIYIAPANAHLFVERGMIRVEHSPPEGYFRPSIDVLFRSAASSYGCRVVGVLLSGMLTDGAAGLWQIRKHGGITIVQDPTEAAYPEMPRNAIATVPIHYCLPLAEIARKLADLTTEHPAPAPIAAPRPRASI